MITTKDTGLAAIARSTRKVADNKSAQTSIPTHADEPLPIKLEGWLQHTSISIDAGIFSALADTVHAIKKQLRGTGRGPVTLGQVLETAFLMFHELPLDQKTNLVRKHRDR
jgi:hypothetical protein